MSQNKAVVVASVIAIATARYLLFSNTSKVTKDTLAAKWPKKLQNHPVTAAMIMAGSFVIDVSAFLTAIMGIVQFDHWIAS
ncbi:MAG: hypothetical protein D6732_29360 [Methanobacteriota archaeon]|nr:MAG: hypothetical protein D6732_29360 [Euryarchaeota archaeon]